MDAIDQSLGSEASVVSRLRKAFDSGRTRPLTWRREQLRALKSMLVTQEKRLLDALNADLRKAPSEGWATEIASVIEETRLALDNLGKWTGKRRVPTAMLVQPGKCWLQAEPLGVVLNIAAWNYPIQESLTPLASATAAGNCVLLKPSELAPHSAAALAELVPQHLDDDCFAVVEAGPEGTGRLLEERFDHILYTGNGRVGSLIAEAAAKHLTPVTLELGGKSPAVVTADADIAVAARRIAWAKWQNVGQICIAPDYVLAQEPIADELIAAIKAETVRMYGEQPRQSADYGRIINQRHFDRLAGYLDQGAILHGGETDRADLYIAPTLIDPHDLSQPVMTEEIFGPILPILRFSQAGDAIAHIAAREKPLALYLFLKDTALRDRFLAQTSSGNVCVNDALMFMVVPGLPFGGVGKSGYGRYSGKWGFDTFSHLKPVLHRANILDLSARYPPFTSRKDKLLRRLRG